MAILIAIAALAALCGLIYFLFYTSDLMVKKGYSDTMLPFVLIALIIPILPMFYLIAPNHPDKK